MEAKNDIASPSHLPSTRLKDMSRCLQLSDEWLQQIIVTLHQSQFIQYHMRLLHLKSILCTFFKKMYVFIMN